MQNLTSVGGLSYVGNVGSGILQIGGVEEHLFVQRDGNPMTPELVESWNIDPAGHRIQMTLKPGIKFNSPVGFEHINFGEMNANEAVEFFNRINLFTNPSSGAQDGGDYAAVFLRASTVDEFTFEIGLVSPIYFCLPVTQFGCLSADRGVFKVTHADTMGVPWAIAHQIGTGPFVQGDDCDSNTTCSVEAVAEHWRQVADVAKVTAINVPDNQIRLAMLRNDLADMAVIDQASLFEITRDGFKFLETMNGAFVGVSVLFPGNLWEHTHVRTNEYLFPWFAPSYLVDYPWIGNPWGHQGSICTPGISDGRERCGDAPYTDTDNPPGVDDMEQARLVRLALSTAISRNGIVFGPLDGYGTPIYSEYMGPHYPGWNPGRETGCFDWLGERIDCSGTGQSVRWELDDADLTEASALLDAAGYPLVYGVRQGFAELRLQTYTAEVGSVSYQIADHIVDRWSRLGVPAQRLDVNYGGVVSPRMRQRIEFLPILKNGDVHSNVYPIDFPFPAVDTSSSRPGWGVGFESQAGARWLFEILSEIDPAVRTEKHLDWVDYSLFWVQYAGVIQVPKGIVVNNRIESWAGRQQHYRNVSTNLEFIRLRR